MVRNRVLSFMSQLSHRDSRSPSPRRESSSHTSHTTPPTQTEPFPAAPPSPAHADYAPGYDSRASGNGSPAASLYGRTRSTSRPMSIVQTYQPHIMDINDTIPELQPIFTFLNSHANKLYQEGYFLKLDDQNSQGRPNADRNWTECFAQLVGTVLSLWDAAELDAAGDSGEVLPKFINLTDASIKVIDSLPTRTPDEQPLQNILSVSTAGRNRYLLHFNSHHSLIQWTSSIRLAMFEQSTLQEAYTGALIAGKGRSVNNINLIMDRTRFKTDLWVRVRFGAGVPWRRCWCVITPPDEKEVHKLQKEAKKRSPYDRSHAPVPKGEIRFYDTKKEGKKQKRAKPIASLTNAFSAYAIYPQSKALIDASTLIKIEGTISIHSTPPSTTEGFVFIMPEAHPAVTGFEMLLRTLFPTWDIFGLYGRPGRLAASVHDPRSLMFAMPKHRRYGYLEIMDVAGLLLTEGSSSWTEREWRKKLKELTGQRMAAVEDGRISMPASRRASSRSTKRLSFGPSPGGNIHTSVSMRSRVGFTPEETSDRRLSRSDVPASLSVPRARNESAPPATSERQRYPSAMAQAMAIANGHGRNLSDDELSPLPGANLPDPFTNGATPSPSPPIRGVAGDLPSTPERVSSEDELPSGSETPSDQSLAEMRRRLETPEPVQAPPAFNHKPSSRPAATPFHSAELRRANSRLSHSTLVQLVNAGGAAHSALPPDAIMEHSSEREAAEDSGHGLSLDVPKSRGPPPALAQTSPDDGFVVRDQQNGAPSTSQPLRAQTPPPGSSGSGAPTPSSLRNSPSIQRKPLPARSSVLADAEIVSEPQSAISSVSSVAQYYLNEAALDQIHYDGPNRQGTRQDTMVSEASSHYDDASSTTSPDYASTHVSVETQESRERPRAGVLRTVGEIAPASRSSDSDLGIPEVDFGRTLNYAAQPASGSKTPTTPRAVFSADGPQGAAAAVRTFARDPSEARHQRQDSDDTVRRRSVAWQATSGQAIGEPRAGALTPEQFVQQRAAQAPMPHYAHQRLPSNDSLAAIRTNNSSTPTLLQAANYDLMNAASSAQLQQRPSSQGPGHALNGRAGSGDIGSHLSAREQEHLARMTGGPLINMAANGRNPPAESGAGLVGAIAAREREKQQMREGYSSQAVQHAINQRQQQQQLMQQQQFVQQQQLQQQQLQQQQLQQQQLQQQQLQLQQQQQMYAGAPQQAYGGYQLPAGHGPPQMRPPMGAPQGSYGPGQPPIRNQPMPGGWPMVPGSQQAPYMGNAQQTYPPQGYQGYSQSPNGMAPQRAGTPGSMGQGQNVVYPGRAF